MQNINDFKKGDSVKFGEKNYRVQEDKGWKHIVKRDNGNRKKYDLELVLKLNDLETVEGWQRLYEENIK